MRTVPPTRPAPDPAWAEPERRLVVQWRLRRLLTAGFARQTAVVLAEARDVDLHALLALTDRGCPPELAVRILGPDEPPAEAR